MRGGGPDRYVECRNRQRKAFWAIRVCGFLCRRSRRIGCGSGWWNGEWNDEGVSLVLLLMLDAVMLSDCQGD